MSSYRGYDGIWATFDYDGAPYLIATYKDVIDAARECASQSFGKVVFLRQGLTFQECIDWFLTTDDKERDWSILRIAVLKGFEIARLGDANVDQMIDIITNRVWMDYLGHEVGVSCVSTPTDPVAE